MSQKRKAWASSPEMLRSFLAANSPEEQWEIATLASPEADMTHYGWVEVGHAEVEYSFLQKELLIPEGIRTLDLAERKLREDLNDKLRVLRGLRQDLLALTAPEPEAPSDE